MYDEKKVKSIKEKIIESERLNPNDRFTYQDLINLSIKYKINEKDLAFKVLGISQNQYYNCNAGSTKTVIILKADIKHLSTAEMKEFKMKIFAEEILGAIKQELLIRGKVKQNNKGEFVLGEE